MMVLIRLAWGDSLAMEDELKRLLLVVRSLVEFRATCLLLAYVQSDQFSLPLVYPLLPFSTCCHPT